MSNEGRIKEMWDLGWEAGFKWAKENHHIDKSGHPNVMGDCLSQGYNLYPDKWNKGFDGGFAEGIKSFLLSKKAKQ